MHQLELDRLAARKVDDSLGERPGLGDDRLQQALDPLRRDAARRAPLLVALSQRAVAGQQLVERGVGRLEHGLVGVLGPVAVAPLSLVAERQPLAGQEAGVGVDAEHLVAQPAGLELVEQRLGVGDQRLRGGRRLGLDLGGQLRRADVGIDQVGVVAAELEAEPEIAASDGVGHAGERTRPQRLVP